MGSWRAGMDAKRVANRRFAGAALVLAALLPAALAGGAAAQWVPPEVAVNKISAGQYPHVEEDEAVVVTEAELSALRAKSASLEEMAEIRVVFKGKWYQSAEYLAREKAAALGANYLVLRRSAGDEDLGAGALRSYRALRLLDFQGKPLYQPQPGQAAVPRSAPPALTPAPAPPPAEKKPAAPEGHRHFAWAWRAHPSVLSHAAVFDPAAAGTGEAAELREYVRERFGGRQSAKLERLLKKGAPVTIDFLAREVR